MGQRSCPRRGIGRTRRCLLGQKPLGRPLRKEFRTAPTLSRTVRQLSGRGKESLLVSIIALAIDYNNFNTFSK